MYVIPAPLPKNLPLKLLALAFPTTFKETKLPTDVIFGCVPVIKAPLSVFALTPFTEITFAALMFPVTVRLLN